MILKKNNNKFCRINKNKGKYIYNMCSVVFSGIAKQKLFVLSIVLFINNTSLFAQCAMCKSSVESNLKNGGNIGTGLNTGILYLMAIPYLILMIGVYSFFKKPIDAKIKVWRNKFPPIKR